jgi:hypothetical protein
VSTFPSPLIANGARLGDMARAGRGLAALVGWEVDWGRNVERMPAAPQAVGRNPSVAAVLPESTDRGASRRTPKLSTGRCSMQRGGPRPCWLETTHRAGSSQVNFSSRAQP